MSERVMSERVISQSSSEQIRELLDSLYRVDSGRILATLIRLLGDFDLAEEAMHEAFAAALSLWPRSGVPGNPRFRRERRMTAGKNQAQPVILNAVFFIGFSRRTALRFEIAHELVLRRVKPCSSAEGINGFESGG